MVARGLIVSLWALIIREPSMNGSKLAFLGVFSSGTQNMVYDTSPRTGGYLIGLKDTNKG